jgi:hypothetical protein
MRARAGVMARAGGRDGLTVLEYFFITERK